MFGLNEIQKEIVRRRDMRDVFTFTIDPADAKDFDDALSFAVVEDEEQSSNDIKQPQTISNAKHLWIRL